MKLRVGLMMVGIALTSSATTVTPVSVAKSGDGSIAVSYSIDAEAVVTAAFAYDGTAIPADRCWSQNGDVNRLVAAGSRRFVWRADRDHALDGVESVDVGKLKVTLTAHPKSSPPDYMVVSMLQPGVKLFYASEAAVPNGVTNRCYKGDYMIFRRMPAAGVVWRMGLDGNNDTCIPHLVKLTADYYIGVYNLTRLQYYLAQHYGGAASPAWLGTVVGDGEETWYCAQNGISPIDFRGGLLWPEGGHTLTTAACPLGYLRTATGLSQLDLPTDAQWEFAARVGDAPNKTDWANEAAEVKGQTSGCGWYGHWGEAGKNGPIEVGLYPPSKMGLYDLHGNVYDTCLDYLAGGNDYAVHFATEPVEDPKGPVRANANKEKDGQKCRVCRGGVWSDGSLAAIGAKPGSNQYETYSGQYMGFRLVTPLPW